MSEAGKLVLGFVGVVIGLAGGFVALVFVMQRTGGVLFDRPAVLVAVALGLVGGGAALMGYLSLTVVEYIERRKKRAARKKKQRGKK
ncbi:MAG: hypothetical protein U9R79_07825 [Armatimonadota bacterium]|nr:hypothetical protein [Armatimonadota bacterium]